MDVILGVAAVAVALWVGVQLLRQPARRQRTHQPSDRPRTPPAETRLVPVSPPPKPSDAGRSAVPPVPEIVVHARFPETAETVDVGFRRADPDEPLFPLPEFED